MSGVYEPAFWVVSCCSRHIRITTRTQQTLMLLIICNSHKKRIWIRKCIYKRYIYILNPYPLLFVMHITTSQSAGVLHVPACNHDRPPKAGIYFLCTCAVYRIIFLTGCAYRHTRNRPVVGAGDLLCRQNRGYKE